MSDDAKPYTSVLEVVQLPIADAAAVDCVADQMRLRATVEALERVTKERDEWREAAQFVVNLFDPLKATTSPALLTAVAHGAKHANTSLRAERDEARAAQLRNANTAVRNANDRDAALAACAEFREALRQEREFAPSWRTCSSCTGVEVGGDRLR